MNGDLLLGVGAAALIGVLAVVFYLRWREGQRRRRAWINVFKESAVNLAEKREVSRIALGKDRDFNAIAHALNQISLQMAGGEEKVQRAEHLRRTILERLHNLRSAVVQAARLQEPDLLRAALAQSVVDVFGAGRAQLWLHVAYIPEKEEAQGAADSDGGNGGAHAGAELARAGFEPVAVSLRNPDRAGEVEKLPLPVGGVLEAARTQRTFSLGQLRDSPIFEQAQARLAEHGFWSYVAMPLLWGDQTLGVLEVYGERPWGEDEIRMMELFAQEAALMLAQDWTKRRATRTREILEMKNLELALANRKLERTNVQISEADRLKGEFLSNTSHELRTPLNSILGFARLILSDAIKDPAEMKQYVKTIHDSGERLLRLINEVLDLAKIEAGKLKTQLGPVDVRSLLEAVQGLMHVQVAQQNNVFKIDVPDVRLPFVRADQSKLHQVLVNIVGNANKFTKDGIITMRVHPEHIPGFMLIEVIDTGIGIDADEIKRLFKSFVQADGSITRRYGGTGLGLTISKKIVELFGGAISLASPGKGKGTTVSVELPLWSDDLESQQPEATRGAARPEPVAEDRPLAVVVEDYLEFQRYLKELLETHGWAVRTARTAQRGMELIHQHRPAVVVLDIHLPSEDENAEFQNGYDVIRSLSREREGPIIPVFVVTGMHREACDQLLGQTITMPVEIFAKPLNEEMFLTSLQRLKVGV